MGRLGRFANRRLTSKLTATLRGTRVDGLPVAEVNQTHCYKAIIRLWLSWDEIRRHFGEDVMEVGIRELRDGLSKHLKLVRAGQIVTITDHGKPVAQITPVGVPTPFERLVAEGRITPGRRTARPQPTAVGRVSDLIAEQRR